ncbi:hypothetical protein OS493_014074 [Desmophyllum pertusum]|uniref:Uncharacterized protein n=1 Tax=Desmophyllum pertusum TaxID=174260 RepID=A0A9W9ZDZ9_9CNID|nr:hypothetical protein OS493_014074 [Desmophyllum pertusum]
MAKDPHITEIVKGNENLKDRMEDDVVEMCKLLKALNTLIDVQPRENEDLREGLKKHFKDIYWSLKLHLVFHLGTDDLAHQATTELEEVGRLVGVTDEEIRLLPDQIHAIDPGSKVLEIVSDITNHNVPRGSEGHADEVMGITKYLLSTLSSKNIFRPRVLAMVSHNDKWFSVGSSIAPLDAADIRQINNWSCSAFLTKGQCTESKAPCQSCKMMFKNLVGFISNDDPRANLGEGDVQLGGCAEYCPVDQILADDVEPALHLSEYESQLIDDLLQRNRDRCSVLFREFRTIVEECSEAYQFKDITDQTYLYRKIRHKVHIFGLKPECNHHF